MYKIKIMAYVYKHTRLDTNEVFYIGIGKYLKRAYSKRYRNNYWINITNKVDWSVEIIEFDLSWEEACEKEKYWIKFYGRKDLKEGTLVNMTDGGEGVKGHSDELKNRLRNYNLGKTLSNEHKNKISSSMKSKVLTENHKKSISDKLKGVNHSESHKNKISISMRGKMCGDKNPNYGKHLTEEVKEKIRIKAKNRPKLMCPNCGKLIDITAKRWHFDNCKFVH